MSNSNPPRLSMADHRLLADIEHADEVVAAKARSRTVVQAAIDRARGRDGCPKCGEPMEDAAPHPGERDTNIPAFAGGSVCTDCGLEVEEEEDEDAPRPRGFGPLWFIPFGLAVAAWLSVPTAPFPLDETLPSTGLHDAAEVRPAPVTDGWRGFLWTT